MQEELEKVLISRLVDDSEEALEALKTFHKQGIMIAHEKLRSKVEALDPRHRDLRNTAQKFFMLRPRKDRFLMPAKLAGAVDSGMHLIRLSELEVNKWHQGRFLKGKLVVRAFRYVRLPVTVLEEDETGLAVRVCTSETFTMGLDVENVLPEGAEVIIKEPCLVQNHFVSGTNLWLANPASIEIVRYYPEVEELGDEPEVLRKLANMQHVKRNHAAAAELYTRSAELSVTVPEKLVAISNRSQAWLKMENYEKALADAETALALDPFHVKSIARKVRALFGLSQFQTAAQFVREVSKTAERLMLNKVFSGLHKEAQIYDEQSRLGNHDLSGYFIAGCTPSAVPVLADFVGPVQFGLTVCDSYPRGDGRGLFLTSDVRQGDLLMISNAFSAVTIKNEPPTRIPGFRLQLPPLASLKMKLVTEMTRKCLAQPRNLAKVYSMKEWSDIPEGLVEVSMLHKPLPSLNLFEPNVHGPGGKDEHKDEELDVKRFFAIAAASRQNVEQVDGVQDQLFLLPAFMNHSCLPNVSTRQIGDTKLVFAAKDMKAGTELLCSQMSMVQPRVIRNRLGTCNCPRCRLELWLESSHELDNVTKAYSDILARGLDYRELAKKVAVKLEKLMVTSQSLAELSKEEKNWIRTSYCLAYTGCFGMVDVPEMPGADDIVQGLYETVPGDLNVLKLMLGYKSTQEALQRVHGRVPDISRISCRLHGDSGHTSNCCILLSRKKLTQCGDECILKHIKASCGHLEQEVVDYIFHHGASAVGV